MPENPQKCKKISTTILSKHRADLVEVTGKRGIKQLVTVFGDAPDENKELAKTETCEGDGGDYIFEPSENPLG